MSTRPRTPAPGTPAPGKLPLPELAAMKRDGRKIVAEARIGAVDDQVRAVGRGPLGLDLDLREPGIELLDRAAVRGREGADHAGAACCLYERRPRHQEHRRRDQRQAQAPLKVGRQRHGSGGTTGASPQSHRSSGSGA